VNWFKSSRKKESEDYEKEFLSRYKKQQKAKPEKKASKHKKVIEIESDEKNQDGEIKILKKRTRTTFYKIRICQTGIQRYNKKFNGCKKSIERYKRRYSKIK